MDTVCPFQLGAVPGPVRSQCLISNQIFPRKNPHFDLIGMPADLGPELHNSVAQIWWMIPLQVPRILERGKRDDSQELLRYLERADERFLQHSKDINDALLQNMEADTNALPGLMGCMVALMEGQANK